MSWLRKSVPVVKGVQQAPEEMCVACQRIVAEYVTDYIDGETVHLCFDYKECNKRTT